MNQAVTIKKFILTVILFMLVGLIISSFQLYNKQPQLISCINKIDSINIKLNKLEKFQLEQLKIDSTLALEILKIKTYIYKNKKPTKIELN